MTAHLSLRASADAADTIGRPELARQYRLWAVTAEALGPIGDALYRHFASDAANYITPRLIEFRRGRESNG